MTVKVLSVTQALMGVKGCLENIKATIIGEVSELSDKPSYKAIYFTLADDKSSLSCLMWRNIYMAQATELSAGMLVEVSGNFSVYPAKGRLNFTVQSLKPAGEGDLRVKVARLAELLRAQGLMDASSKPQIPTWINKVAVITSPRGKAIHDVLRTLRRRNPLIAVEVYGVAVEGKTAADELTRALELANRGNCDVIILGRGGGSYEDLMPFNDEGLARAIAASTIPVITGIGHEPDTTIADMVATRRASTPTAAAEAVSYPKEQLLGDLDARGTRLAHALRQRLNFEQQKLAHFEQNNLFKSGTALFAGRWLELDQAQGGLLRAGNTMLKGFDSALDLKAAQLDALSPLAVLTRGYSITYDNHGHIVRSSKEINVGQALDVRFSDGRITTTVISQGEQ